MATGAKTDDIDIAVDWSFQMIATGTPNFVVFFVTPSRSLFMQTNSTGVSVSREWDEKHLFTATTRDELHRFLSNYVKEKKQNG